MQRQHTLVGSHAVKQHFSHTTWAWLNLVYLKKTLLASLALACMQATAVTLSTPPQDMSMRQPFEATVQADKQATLASEMGGKVTQLYVKAGDWVKQGQLLVALDARASADQAKAAQAAAQAASASAILAAKDLERKRQLFAAQYISQAALDQAQASYQASTAQAQAAAAQAKAAQTALSYQHITAPFNGQISNVMVELGDLAYAGRPVLSINTPQQLKVVVQVPAAVQSKNNALQNVVIQVGTGQQAVWFSADRVQVLPSINPQSLTQEVRYYISSLNSANQNNANVAIAVGQYAKVWLPVNVGAVANTNGQSVAPLKKVYIPASAVVRRGDVTAVYVVNAQKVKTLRQVQVGQTVGVAIEVLSGLALGERVVIHP